MNYALNASIISFSLLPDHRAMDGWCCTRRTNWRNSRSADARNAGRSAGYIEHAYITSSQIRMPSYYERCYLVKFLYYLWVYSISRNQCHKRCDYKARKTSMKFASISDYSVPSIVIVGCQKNPHSELLSIISPCG